jgi:hypothetical protein
MIYIKIKDGWASHIDTNPHSDTEAEKLKDNYPAEEFNERLHLVDGDLIMDTQDNRDAYDLEQANLLLETKINNLKIVVAGDIIDALNTFELPIAEGHEADAITESLLQNPLFFVYAERLNLTDERLMPIMAQVDAALQQMSEYTVNDILKYIVEKNS